MLSRPFTRRRVLAAAASLVGAGAATRFSGLPASLPGPAQASGGPMETKHAPTIGLADGRTTVDPRVNGFDPTAILRDFDWGKTRRLASGRVLREWQLVASDKEIEPVPGVKFAAWTYEGRV